MFDYQLAKRCVFIFRLPKIRYAIKFLLFPGQTVGGATRGCFVWGPRRRILDDAIFLGEVHLAEGALDLEVVAHESCHVAHHAYTSGKLDDEDCAELCGQICAAICDELRRLGQKVPVMLVPKNVERYDDLWPGVEFRNLLFNFSPTDPQVETGDPFDGESWGDQEQADDEDDEDEDD
jgi:hypothetical protein